MYDAFNNENKFNKRMDKSWYDMIFWELQSAKIEKIKCCKFNNKTKGNFPVKRQNKPFRLEMKNSIFPNVISISISQTKWHKRCTWTER